MFTGRKTIHPLRRRHINLIHLLLISKIQAQLKLLVEPGEGNIIILQNKCLLKFFFYDLMF